MTHRLRNALVAAATLTALAYIGMCVATWRYFTDHDYELSNQTEWA